MSELGIKDFMLDKKAEDTDDKPQKKTKPSVQFEMVVVSGPDFVVRRKTTKTSKLLAIIMSARQYYIKTESTGEIQPLTAQSFATFLKDCDEQIDLHDKDGNVPFWVDTLQSNPKFKYLFLSALESEPFCEYACKHIAVLPVAARNNMYNNNIWTTASYHAENPVFNTSVKPIFHTVMKCLTEELGVDNLRETLQAYSQESQKVRGIFRKLSVCERMLELYHLEGLRKMLHMFLTTPVTSLPNEYRLENVLYRTSHANHYSFAQPSKQNRTPFDLDSLLEYMFCECTAQGMAESIDNFLTSWADYLDMTMELYRRIDDKYPKYLLSQEAVLSYKLKKLEDLKKIQGMETIAKQTEQYEETYGNYTMLSPHCVEDLIDEETQQTNCVASYVNRILNGSLYIFFLRKKESPQKSHVTVEVLLKNTHGNIQPQLGQVLARFNKTPSTEATAWVTAWFQRHFGETEQKAV